MSSPPYDDVTHHLRDDLAHAQARIASMQADMAALVAASLDSNADDEHDPEGQTIAYERSQLAALTARTHQLVADLEATVVRVEAGTWGVCDTCSRPIGSDRMEARPTATTCMACLAARDASR